jgi:SAM-dependent methyltransferase
MFWKKRDRDPSMGGPFERRDYGKRERFRANYEQLGRALADVLDFETHLDVGCGQGLLISALSTSHGKDCRGVEGSAAAVEFADACVREKISIATVEELRVGQQYDLVSCVEVLEHIAAADADAALRFLTHSARKWLYFSAAIPGQGGTGHINCQPSIHWILSMRRHGFALALDECEALRERIVGMEPCVWLPQNALIFCRETPLMDQVSDR